MRDKVLFVVHSGLYACERTNTCEEEKQEQIRSQHEYIFMRVNFNLSRNPKKDKSTVERLLSMRERTRNSIFDGGKKRFPIGIFFSDLAIL